MIQNRGRIPDSGDFYILPGKGEQPGRQVASRRGVNSERSTTTVEGEVEGWKFKYNLTCATDGAK